MFKRGGSTASLPGRRRSNSAGRDQLSARSSRKTNYMRSKGAKSSGKYAQLTNKEVDDLGFNDVQTADGDFYLGGAFN